MYFKIVTKSAIIERYGAKMKEKLVWSIMDNAWVTLEYWNWINGKCK